MINSHELFSEIKTLLQEAVSEDYAEKIALAIYRNVKDNIKENADENYSSYDVKLAIGRELMDRYKLWDADMDILAGQLYY